MTLRLFCEGVIALMVLTLIFGAGIAVGENHKDTHCQQQQWLDTSRGC